MPHTFPGQNGPDKLDNLASQAEANGLHINAETFTQLARDWRQLEADLERAQQRNAELTRALDRARQSATRAATELAQVA